MKKKKINNKSLSIILIPGVSYLFSSIEILFFSLSLYYSPDEEFVEYALTGVCVSTLRQELLRLLISSAIGARCPSGVGSII